MPTTNYTVVGGELLSEDRAGTKRDYVPDPLGSTVALLDNTQSQTDTFTYWPYGEVKTRVGANATPFQYLGTVDFYRDTDARTYAWTRYLDVQKGQWLIAGYIYAALDAARWSNSLEKTSPITLFPATTQDKPPELIRLFPGIELPGDRNRVGPILGFIPSQYPPVVGVIPIPRFPVVIFPGDPFDPNDPFPPIIHFPELPVYTIGAPVSVWFPGPGVGFPIKGGPYLDIPIIFPPRKRRSRIQLPHEKPKKGPIYTWDPPSLQLGGSIGIGVKFSGLIQF